MGFFAGPWAKSSGPPCRLEARQRQYRCRRLEEGTQEITVLERGGARPAEHRQSDTAKPCRAKGLVAAPPEATGSPLRQRRPGSALWGLNLVCVDPPGTVWPRTVCPTPYEQPSRERTPPVREVWIAGGATANEKPQLG
ncbi:hypothetical protein NDU88_000848 [Pleurodeles waltl]|uniref:Uncharacterized protein n=1 Tax=Pleurodeles waltl TaxID=8319 RepID=A0AAV7WLV6_PLEWA|nr:hypothetical protein NDU88_000848 [Pleurodeles waltl]